MGACRVPYRNLRNNRTCPYGLAELVSSLIRISSRLYSLILPVAVLVSHCGFILPVETDFAGCVGGPDKKDWRNSFSPSPEKVQEFLQPLGSVSWPRVLAACHFTQPLGMKRRLFAPLLALTAARTAARLSPEIRRFVSSLASLGFASKPVRPSGIRKCLGSENP